MEKNQPICERCGKPKCVAMVNSGACPRPEPLSNPYCHGICQPESEKGKEMPVPNDRCRVCHVYPHRGEEHHPDCMFKPSRAEGWEADFTSRFDHHGWMLKPEVIRAVIEYFKPRLLSSRQSAIEECVKAVENINDFTYKLPAGQVYGLETTDGKDAIKGWRKCREVAIRALRRRLREESEDKKDGV